MPDYKSETVRIHKRMDKLVACDTCEKPDCKGLRKRLIKFRDSLFTFLDDPSVPF